MSTPKITKAQRWLDLVAFLVGRRFPVTRSEIYAAVPAYASEQQHGDTEPESLRKKFLRDKTELEALGILIETRELRGHDLESHGYIIRSRDFYLPYLRLLEQAGAPSPSPAAPPRGTAIDIEPGEAGLALDGLHALSRLPEFPWRAEARSAWRKLSFDLVPHPDEPSLTTFIAPREGPEVMTRLTRLSEALSERRRAHFDYLGVQDPAPTRREVEPRGLIFKNNRWYLVAHDTSRQAMRTFRLSRMASLEFDTTPSPPHYEIPGEFSLEAWLQAQPWDLPNEELERESVTVRFAFPRSIWTERNRLGHLVERRNDGAQLRRFEVRQRDAFLRWVLSLDGDAEVIDPPEVREAWAKLIRDVLGLYRDPLPPDDETP